jgi:parvulin-like peptidyl-prolyl isomerase
MQYKRWLGRAGLRCAALAVLAVLVGTAFAGAFSACSVDFFKPESYQFIKDAIASSGATPSAGATPAVVGKTVFRSSPEAVDTSAAEAPSAAASVAAAQPIALPPPPEGAANPSRLPRIVPASDAPGSFSLPHFGAKEQAPPQPPNAVPANVDEEANATGPAVDRVVASVDGDPITMREVKDFAAQHGEQIDTDNFGESETAKTAVKALIGEKLLEQEVKKYDAKVDEDQVDRYITRLRTDRHLSDAEFRAQLQASGMSYDELRKRARLDLEKSMMIEEEVRAQINVPDSAVKAYYDAHKTDFTITKERLRISQILVALPANPTPAQVAAAQKKAAAIRARAVKGDDFGDLARLYSDDDSKSSGGELGWFAPGDVNDTILAAVKPLKPGEVSAPVRTSHGIHILKLEDHQVPGLVPLSDVKEQIRQELVDEQSAAALQKWVESDLVKQHYVETMY